MEHQDDPEARIRELERSVGNQGPSELGVAQPSGQNYPSTPPPPIYSSPMPVPRRRTSAGFGGWWIVFAVLAVGALGLAMGVAVFSSQLFSSPTVNVPTIPSNVFGPGGVGTGDQVPPGGRLTISGIGKNETLACNDGIVTVSGQSNTIVITGHCASLTVSGIENMVTVDSADTITASGVDNEVIFHSGTPRISTPGSGNVVRQG